MFKLVYGGQPVYLWKDYNEVLVSDGTTGTKPGQDIFYLSQSVGDGNTPVDLTATTIAELKGIFLKTQIVNRSLMLNADGNLASWKVAQDGSKFVTIHIKTPSKYSLAYDDLSSHPGRLAGCPMGEYADNEAYARMCQVNGIDTPNPKADVIMMQYCTSPVGDSDPKCSCYHTDREVDKLPAELDQYKPLLRAQPRCWLPNCANKGYHNAVLREPVNCSFTICSQRSNVQGNDNTVTSKMTQICKSDGSPLMVNGGYTPTAAPTAAPAGVSTAAPTTPTPTGVPAVDDSAQPQQEQPNMIGWIFLMFVLIGIAIYIYLSDKSDSLEGIPSLNVTQV